MANSPAMMETMEDSQDRTLFQDFNCKVLPVNNCNSLLKHAVDGDPGLAGDGGRPGHARDRGPTDAAA